MIGATLRPHCACVQHIVLRFGGRGSLSGRRVSGQALPICNLPRSKEARIDRAVFFKTLFFCETAI
jgi:hypothetical protein